MIEVIFYTFTIICLISVYYYIDKLYKYIKSIRETNRKDWLHFENINDRRHEQLLRVITAKEIDKGSIRFEPDLVEVTSLDNEKERVFDARMNITLTTPSKLDYEDIVIANGGYFEIKECLYKDEEEYTYSIRQLI